MKRYSAVLTIGFAVATTVGCDDGQQARTTGSTTAAKTKAKGKEKDKAGAEAPLPAGRALIERLPQATLAWMVGPDGKTELAVRSNTCQLLDKVSGKVEFIRASDGKKQQVLLKRDSATGRLVGNGPALDPELTELRYQLNIAGEPASGTLHLPKGGTKALNDVAAASPKAAASAEPAAAAPHGGQVQTIDDTTYEVVADTETGVMRVYLLTRDLKPSTVEPKELRLAIGGSKPRVLRLLRSGEEADVHYAALLRPTERSRKLTLVVKDAKAKLRVVLLGLRKGQALTLDPDVRRRFWVKKDWAEQAKDLEERAAEAEVSRADADEGGDDKDKVTICHIPKGNPANQKTLEVAASAVEAHLAHGDHKGPCKDDAAADKGKGKGEGKGPGEGKGKGPGEGKGKGPGEGQGQGKGPGQGQGKGKGKGK